MTAGLEGVVLTSSGCRLLGGLYRAAGAGRRPAVVMLHGIPGFELNLDLAQTLRTSGLHVLFFHYRGAWGSEGAYSLTHLVPDTLTALDWLAARPDVDTERLGLVGMSMGGWAAFAAAADDERPRAVVALSPLVDPADVPMPPDLAQESAAVLRDTSAEALREEWASLTPVVEFAPRLTERHLLLITGNRDELLPPAHFTRLQVLLPSLTWVRFPSADHVFSDTRPGLRHTVRQWLIEVLDPP